MFGFFSRKQQPAAKVSNIQSDAMAVDSEPQQLRTPSPSEAAFNGLGSAAITNTTMTSPSPEISKPAVPPTPEALHSLVSTIPPKTLHAYVLTHIPVAPPDTLLALASFFATLIPPPLLHCVRCHADYTEVENNDRSCRVPHDDDSTDVEWVSRGRGDCEHETFWGCCSKRVDGEGDLGPPDGWCYEGMHTTDIKRARFRADSTHADDKLDSCFRLNCHNIRARLPNTSASTSGRAKRARPPPGKGDIDDDDGGSEGTEDTGIAEIAHGVRALGQQKGKGKGKGRAKPKVAVAAATLTPARVLVPPREPESDGGSSKAGRVNAPVVTVPTTRRRRRRRRTCVKPRSAASFPGKAVSPPSSPGPRGRKPPSVTKMDSVEIVVRSRSRSRVRGGGGGGAETGDEKTMTDSEGKVRKRRRVAFA